MAGGVDLVPVVCNWTHFSGVVHPFERTRVRLRTLPAALRHMPVRRAASGGWQCWCCAEPVWGSACSTAAGGSSVARLSRHPWSQKACCHHA